MDSTKKFSIERNTMKVNLDLILAKLNFVIDNWDSMTLEETRARFLKVFGITFATRTGICHNCGIDALPFSVRTVMFSTFEQFSGSVEFPVDGWDEYSSTLQNGKKYREPKRKALAEHCVKYIRENKEAILELCGEYYE